MDIQSNGGVQFKALAGKFRAAGKDGAAIRKALTKKIQTELKKIVDEQRHAAAAMKVKGVAGRGSARREAFHGVKRKRPLRAGYGLRATTARSIKSKVSYTGFKMGARITVDTKALPQSQRKLPRYLNRTKGWRHPVWGNRERWVAQYGEPYFDKPIERHLPDVRKAVNTAVTEVMRTLQ